jgi:hypothetical protein
MTVMGIDPAGLRAAEPAVAGVASCLQEVLRSLEIALEIEGTCWGSDHTGRVFGESYLPAATQARQAGALLHEGVRTIAAAILTVAGNADAVEGRVQPRLR